MTTPAQTPQIQGLPPGAIVGPPLQSQSGSIQGLPPGAIVGPPLQGSISPPATEKPSFDIDNSLSGTSFDPEQKLTSYGAATRAGIGGIVSDTLQAIHGAVKMINPEPQNFNEAAAKSTGGVGALLVHRLMESGESTLRGATQIAAAIHEINQSQDPIGSYLKVAQKTASQGAGQALTALATEGVAKGVGAVASKAAEAVTPAEDAAAAEPKITPAQAEQAATRTTQEAAQSITKEIHPPAAEMNNTAEAVENEMGNVHDFATENKMPLNTHHDLAAAAKASADEARGLYQEKVLGPVADEPVGVAGTNYKGAAVGETQNNATLGAIDQRIVEINKEIRGAYSKTTAGKTGTALANEGELVAEREALTNVLHKELAARTGIPVEDIAALRQRIGRQYTIADNAKAAANQLDLQDVNIRRGVNIPTSKAGVIDQVINKVRGGQPAIAGRGLRKAIANAEEVLPRSPLPEVNAPQSAPFPRPKLVPESAGTEAPSILTREPTSTGPGRPAKPPARPPRPLPAWKIRQMEEAAKNAETKE